MQDTHIDIVRLFMFAGKDRDSSFACSENLAHQSSLD